MCLFCTYYTSVSQHKIFLCRFTPPHSKKVPHLSSISSPVSTARAVIVDTYDYVPAMIHFPMATALDGAIAETHTPSQPVMLWKSYKFLLTLSVRVMDGRWSIHFSDWGGGGGGKS